MRAIDLFDQGADAHPERACFRFGEQAVTYREAQALSRRIAAGLAAEGFAPGAKAAVLSHNDPLAFICILGGGDTLADTANGRKEHEDCGNDERDLRYADEPKRGQVGHLRPTKHLVPDRVVSRHAGRPHDSAGRFVPQVLRGRINPAAVRSRPDPRRTSSG
ncbi:MAG: AMP-binding protein [Opitutaceae bacterium]